MASPKINLNLSINKFLEEFYKECSVYKPKNVDEKKLKNLSEMEIGVQNCANYLGRAIFTEEFGLRKKHRIDLLLKMVTLNPDEKERSGNINVVIQSVEKGLLDAIDVTSEVEKLPIGDKNDF